MPDIENLLQKSPKIKGLESGHANSTGRKPQFCATVQKML
jgi:hypothetical protein